MDRLRHHVRSASVALAGREDSAGHHLHTRGHVERALHLDRSIGSGAHATPQSGPPGQDTIDASATSHRPIGSFRGQRLTASRHARVIPQTDVASPPRRRCLSTVAALAIGSLLVLSQGCVHDPRISLAEFQALQARPPEPVAEEPAAESSVDRYLSPYRVGPSDVLLVTLTGLNLPTESTPVLARVDKAGRIDLPLVEDIDVLDLELSDVEDAIQSAFVPAVVRQLSVHVEVTGYDTTNVIVLGATANPGLITLRRTERSLLFAVLGAGGMSAEASGKVLLRRIRRPQETASFDLTDPRQLEEVLSLEPLENGDIVVVDAAQPNTIFVGGLVNRPAPQIYPPGVRMTVLQTLAAAGGLRTDVTPREGTLIRRQQDGGDVHVKLDLGRIRRGEDENILLAAGDILWIPDSFETRVQDFMNRNLFFRAGISINYTVSGTEFLNSNAERESLRGLGGGGLQDAFDPFGFLSRNAALQSLSTAPPPVQP